MSWQLIITGLLLGTVSSFHCVGMCGPIALSLPVMGLPKQQKTLGIVLYNLGRISIYATAGLIFGFAGRQVYLGGFQQIFSIVMGSLLLLYLIQSLFFKKVLSDSWIQKPVRKLQQWIGHFLQEKKMYGLYLLGMANGLLPCGMVYLAITGAMATGSVAGGIVFMTAFGLGTFPAMFALSFFGSSLSIHTRNHMKKAIPFMVFTMGILLILRGMNLNIPFISPFIAEASNNVIDCP